MNNGLPQGSVLAPVLFNLYISGLPDTKLRNFAFADDLGIVAKGLSLDTILTTLTEDLKSLEAYYKKWRLKPNPLKTVVSSFTLNNRRAQWQLNVGFCGQLIKNDLNPMYLGVTLDHTLTFKFHLQKLAVKLKNRV